MTKTVRNVTVRSVSSEVHSALLMLLRGVNIPKKERTPHINTAYRIKMRRIASCATVRNPLSGKMEDRVVVGSNSNGDRVILLQNDEVEQCIKMYYTNYKGVGARKLHKQISNSFCGISERQYTGFPQQATDKPKTPPPVHQQATS